MWLGWWRVRICKAITNKRQSGKGAKGGMGIDEVMVSSDHELKPFTNSNTKTKETGP